MPQHSFLAIWDIIDKTIYPEYSASLLSVLCFGIINKTEYMLASKDKGAAYEREKDQPQGLYCPYDSFNNNDHRIMLLLCHDSKYKFTYECQCRL